MIYSNPRTKLIIDLFEHIMALNTLFSRTALLEGPTKPWVVACIVLIILLLGFIGLTAVLIFDSCQSMRRHDRGEDLDVGRGGSRWLQRHSQRSTVAGVGNKSEKGTSVV